MKYSIGEWTDSQLQRQIKCISKKEGFENLQEIYEKMCTDPAGALNKIRQKIEILFKIFFNENSLKETSFQNQLSSSNKLKDNSDIKQYFLRKFNDDKQETNLTLDLIYSYGSLTRVYGNKGSHSGEYDNRKLVLMATVSFMAFFELYNIFNNEENIICKHFNDFIYDKLAVIYQTKDDLEEWEKIRFNKLQFEYILYNVEGDLINNKQLLLDKIINKEKETQPTLSKNIYIVDGKDENLLQRFRKFYKKLSSDVSEENYFLINEYKDIEYEIIDTIPLRLLPVDEKNPYKWDMCYINLSVELDDFGVDLILLLNFNPEKFNTTIENYELEINTLE